MLRFLLLAVLLACVSAFVPPATLAQRSVVGRGASQNQAAQTFRSQDIDGDGVISWHEFDGPKTGPMGVDVKSLKDEP